MPNKIILMRLIKLEMNLCAKGIWAVPSVIIELRELIDILKEDNKE
jgi:hypothetical protein